MSGFCTNNLIYDIILSITWGYLFSSRYTCRISQAPCKSALLGLDFMRVESNSIKFKCFNFVSYKSWKYTFLKGKTVSHTFGKNVKCYAISFFLSFWINYFFFFFFFLFFFWFVGACVELKFKVKNIQIFSQCTILKKNTLNRIKLNR